MVSSSRLEAAMLAVFSNLSKLESGPVQVSAIVFFGTCSHSMSATLQCIRSTSSQISCCNSSTRTYHVQPGLFPRQADCCPGLGCQLSMFLEVISHVGS